jgi:hypothetical protein
MSDEDRAFLEKAFEEAYSHVEDPNKIMFEAIAQIKSEERTDTSIITALEVIDRCCDDPDCCRNVETLGGIQTMLDLVGETKQPSIKVRALEILALVLSNNPDIQAVSMKRGALPIFFGLVNSSVAGSEERSKAFRALVALIRQVEEYEDGFLRKDSGISAIAECMCTVEDPRCREKAMNFVTSLGSRERLQKKDVETIATALLPLFEDLADASIQYKWTLGDCVLVLANAGVEAQKEALRAAVVARLVALKKASDTEEVKREVSTLLESQEALSK